MLSRLLGDPSVNQQNLAIALAAYERARLPRTQHVMKGSRQCGFTFEFNGVPGDNLELVGKEIEALTEWITTTDPEEDVAVALRWMREQHSLADSYVRDILRFQLLTKRTVKPILLPIYIPMYSPVSFAVHQKSTGDVPTEAFRS